MILDADLQLANAFAPTTGSTNVPSLYLDTLALADWGAGVTWIWQWVVNTTVTSAGAATVQINLIGNATDPTFSSGNVTIITGDVIAKASLTKGYQRFFKIPRAAPGTNQTSNNYRYITINAAIGTADLTAGKFDSWINMDAVQDNRAYPSGYSVL